ncbi:hypothetical protein niasHS_008439 [Heterodera schachtii]|uniref:Uncharacterized protein n=1 Tax=Heterodera schachtii TaxID=97005 RepID=A0ABD2J685_HETSC
MSALGVAALALGAGCQSVEAGRPLGAIMASPPGTMKMSRQANDPLLCDSTTGGKNGQPNSSSSTAADFQMSPKNHGTTTVRHRKPNNEQRKSDGPTLKRTMSALGVAALALSAGQSVEAGRPLGTTMEQTLAPPPKPMQMSREANSPLLCDCETNPPPAVPIYSPPPPPPPMFSPPPPPPPATVACPPPPPPATEGALAPPPPATEGTLAPPPPPGGFVITGYPEEDKVNLPEREPFSIKL